MATDTVAGVEALGVRFPVTEGSVSTTAVARRTCAAAAAAVDSSLAARVAAVANWHKDYVGVYRKLTEAAARSPEAALALSAAGLDYFRGAMEFAGVNEATSLDQLQAVKSPTLRTALITGEEVPTRELVVPYNGQRLSGGDLLAQLDDWVRDGVVEPGFRDAVTLVVKNPDWLDLSDTTVAVLGAGAEMGPTAPLLRWGGHVLGIDLPRPSVWRRLIALTRSSGGSLEVPVPVTADSGLSDVDVAAIAGSDIVTQTPDILELLGNVEGPMVLGNYVYADSAAHVMVSAAADALAAGLADRKDLTLAYLATPTDAFAVPWRDVETARERWHHRRTSLLQPPLHLFGAFTRNYTNTVTADDGIRYGIADCLVPQQGPNYALAKRVQRWRAVVARSQGIPVSLNVAPATRTDSVIKNRLLAAAYTGAHRFGIQVFDPHTSNTLMAALLVHDLRNPKSPAQPEVALANPMGLFTMQANHGGLWTSAYEPRSVLGWAAGLGMFESRA
jgi:hypothetical protein